MASRSTSDWVAWIKKNGEGKEFEPVGDNAVLSRRRSLQGAGLFVVAPWTPPIGIATLASPAGAAQGASAITCGPDGKVTIPRQPGSALRACWGRRSRVAEASIRAGQVVMGPKLLDQLQRI